MTNPPPIRVLHAVFSLGPGGIQAWLAQVLPRLAPNRVETHVLVHGDQRGRYGEELERAGIRLLHAPKPSHLPHFTRSFHRLLYDNGPYDVFHAHTAFWSGQLLKLAYKAGIPERFAHSHDDEGYAAGHANAARRAYRLLMRTYMHRYATKQLAVSRRAGISRFGPSWRLNGCPDILFPAIDLSPFDRPVNGAFLRDQLGLPRHAPVIGHVGRPCEQKNQDFLLYIFAALRNLRPDARLLLVGNGPDRWKLEQKAQSLGIAEYTVFTGERRDAAQLIAGVMNVLVLPSRHEGLGRVAIEAQAAGRPALVSHKFPHESKIVPSLVRRLHLDRSPQKWAEAICEMLDTPHISTDAALAHIQESPFNVEINARDLMRLYVDGDDSASPTA